MDAHPGGDFEATRRWAVRGIVHASRTPLTLVAAAAELLADSPDLTEQDGGHAAALVAGVRELRELIDRLAEVAAWPPADAEEATDLAALVGDAVGALRADAAQADVEVAFEAAADVAVPVDAVVLGWAVRALVRQAVHRVGGGGRVEVALDAGAAPRVTITARPGPAAPASGEAASRDEAAAIAREVVARRWGTVTASGLPDGAHRVELVLTGPSGDGEESAAPAGDTPGPPTEVPEPVGPADGRVLLVVEDDDRLRGFLVGELSRDHRVVAVASAEAALVAARRHPPDLVACDIMLPGVGGERLVHVFEDIEELLEVPILILTGRTDDDLRVRLLRDGADDYLTKPFSIEELRARLANLATQRLDIEDLRDEVEQAETLSEQLDRALQSRVVIEQAKAFVAAERAIGVEEAFAVLRDHARSHGARLHDVAAEVVRRQGLRGLA